MPEASGAASGNAASPEGLAVEAAQIGSARPPYPEEPRRGKDVRDRVCDSAAGRAVDGAALRRGRLPGKPRFHASEREADGTHPRDAARPRQEAHDFEPGRPVELAA